MLAERDLNEIPFFQLLQPSVRSKLVSAGRVEVFEPQQNIFHEGDPGSSMFVVLQGSLNIHRRSDSGLDLVLNHLDRGDFFGEIALLDGGERTASATAITRCELFKLDRAEFFNFLSDSSDFLSSFISVLIESSRRGTGKQLVKEEENEHMRRYIEQVNKISASAIAVEAGQFEPETLDEVATRTDELGNLARVFQRMAREVAARERQLVKQLEDLKVEIDQVRAAKQVAEITNSDYFQKLQQKAEEMRLRRNNNPS